MASCFDVLLCCAGTVGLHCASWEIVAAGARRAYSFRRRTRRVARLLNEWAILGRAIP